MKVSDLIKKLQAFQYMNGNRDLYIYAPKWDGYVELDRLILSPENGKSCFIDVVYSVPESLVYEEDIYNGEGFWDFDEL